MAKKEDKVFDVAKPGSSKPEIGSKPMIVGHKSLANDPMVKEEDTEKPAGEAKTVSKNDEQLTQKNTSEKRIEPISGDMKAKDGSTSEPEVKDAEPATESKEDSVKQDDKDSDAKEDSVSAKLKSTEESDTATSDKKEEKKDEKAGGKKEEKVDPAVEAMEKEEELNKLIASKKYNVDIKEKKPGSMKTFIYVFFGTTIVGLVALFVLIDTGTINSNIDLPFSIFGNNDSSKAMPVNEPQLDTKKDATIGEKATNEPVTKSISDTWFVFDNPGYTMSIPDGYVLSKKESSESSLYATTIKYQEGVLATVKDYVASGGPQEFSGGIYVDFTDVGAIECKDYYTKGTISTFKTDSGVTVYSSVEVGNIPKSEKTYVNLVVGETGYNYCVQDKGKIMSVGYTSNSSDSDESQNLIEALKTVVIK